MVKGAKVMDIFIGIEGHKISRSTALRRDCSPAGRIGLAQIVVAQAYGLGLEQIVSRSRKPRIQEARQVVAYLARVVFEVGVREVAREIGRSPGTAVHACQTIEAKRDRPEFDRMMDFLERQLRQAAGMNPDKPTKKIAAKRAGAAA